MCCHPELCLFRNAGRSNLLTHLVRVRKTLPESYDPLSLVESGGLAGVQRPPRREQHVILKRYTEYESLLPGGDTEVGLLLCIFINPFLYFLKHLI